MTWLTLALAVTSLLQWGALISANKSTHMSAKAALIQAYALRGNMRRDQPVMAPVGLGGKEVAQGEQVIGWNVTPKWTNTGATDARNVIAGYGIRVLPISDACPKFAESLDGKAEPSVVGPSGPFLQATLPLKLEDVQKVRDSTHNIFLLGRMQYSDIFPETPTHHFDWCVLVTPYFVDGQPTGNALFSFLKVHERAD